MNPDQGDNFWKEAGSQGTMPQANNIISGEVQAAAQIPIGATHFAMFPQTNATLALVLAIASFAFFTLGNLNAKRDWGSAKDYVKSMWLMLKAKKPSDYVIATGKSYTVKKFVEEAFKYIGVKISWRGKGINEVGIDKKTGQIYVKVDPKYFRPTEVFELRGDSSKAKRELKWKPSTNFKELVAEMMEHDLNEIK